MPKSGGYNQNPRTLNSHLSLDFISELVLFSLSAVYRREQTVNGPPMRGKEGTPHSPVKQSSPWSSGARLARPAELREASKAAKAEADSAGKAPSPTVDPLHISHGKTARNGARNYQEWPPVLVIRGLGWTWQSGEQMGRAGETSGSAPSLREEGPRC